MFENDIPDVSPCFCTPQYYSKISNSAPNFLGDDVEYQI